MSFLCSDNGPVCPILACFNGHKAIENEDVINTVELKLNYVDGIAAEETGLSVLTNNLILANVISSVYKM